MADDEHHQAEQFLATLQARVGRQVQALEQLAARPAAALPVARPAALAGRMLHHMTADDDVQLFLDAFEAMTEAYGWPGGGGEWLFQLLPLLTREAQTPVMGRHDYVAVCKAVMDRLGLLPAISAG